MRFKKYLKEGSYGLHLMKNPAGTYSFVGSVPVQLSWLSKAGKELTDIEAKEVGQANIPAMLAKTRVFKTPKEAFALAKKYGIKRKDIKFNESDELTEEVKYSPIKSPKKPFQYKGKWYTRDEMKKMGLDKEASKVIKEGGWTNPKGKLAGWIAFYGNKKLEIKKSEAKDLYNAKLLAIKKLKVPKSKEGLLAIAPGYDD